MKKIALILCLVLVASFVLSGCNNSDSIITLEDREVGKIEIQSGNTGETVEVTEEEVISQIADILSLEFEKGEKSNDSTGWSYSVRWYDTEESRNGATPGAVWSCKRSLSGGLARAARTGYNNSKNRE